MVEVGPVIHGSSSKLQFQFDPLVFFLEWNCNFQNQMKTLIAGFLWLLYIIFDFQDMDILLFFDQVSYFVNIIYISTYSILGRTAGVGPLSAEVLSAARHFDCRVSGDEPGRCVPG